MSNRSRSRRPQQSRRQRWRRPGMLVGGALIAGAVLDQLRRPRDERTWHGQLLGVIPYDLRPPTLERLRAALWAPQNSHVLSPRAFGVGWDLNVGRVVHLLLGRR